MWTLAVAVALVSTPTNEPDDDDELVIIDEEELDDVASDELSACTTCRHALRSLDASWDVHVGLELSWSVSFDRGRDARRFSRAMAQAGYEVKTLMPFVCTPPRWARRGRRKRERTRWLVVRTHVPCEPLLVEEVAGIIEGAARRHAGRVLE